jgi:hypothetical protein
MKAVISRFHWTLLLAASISACGDRSSQSASQNESNWAAVASNGADDLGSSALLEALQRNFQLAMSGTPTSESRKSISARGNSAGIDCKPAILQGESQSLQITLPLRSAQRPAVLAAIAPDGTLRIIYKSYVPDTDIDSIIIPSKNIDWESAKIKRVFQVVIKKFEALVPGAEAPSPLFRQAGVYQLVLLDGFPYSIPDHGERPFRVIAGCVILWQP